MDSSWRLKDAPEAYVNRIMKGIFGVVFTVDTFTVHKKLHQNYPKAEINNVLGWTEAYA